jgi:hypothetical protein
MQIRDRDVFQDPSPASSGETEDAEKVRWSRLQRFEYRVRQKQLTVFEIK